MKAYQQSDLFNVLLSAARSPQFNADPALQSAYNQKRFSKAMRSLRSRNIFLYTEGTRTSVNLNNTNTIYTQPAGVRLLICGYADNFRYGAVNAATAAGPNPTATTLLGEHRVRIVGGGNERMLTRDFAPAQAGVSGQPRYTDTRLVTPTILEPDEQFAVDLGYDAAGSPQPSVIPPQAFIFFCLKIKDKLTAEDEAAIADIKQFIKTTAFQRKVLLNCVQLGLNTTGLVGGTSVAGDIVQCSTPPVNVPILITGIGSNLQASALLITDTFDGSSFSLNRPMQSSAINLPGYENSPELFTAGAPVVGPIWRSYFELPMPHLLRRGAQLQAQIADGGNAGAGAGTIIEQALLAQLVFQGVTA